MAINNLTRGDCFQFEVSVSKRSMQTNAIDLYAELATKSAIYPGQGTPLGLAYVALKLNGEAGEFAEHVGKAMRDDNLMEMQSDETGLALRDNHLTKERRASLIKEIGDQFWYLCAACRELGINPSEALLINLEKLADRTARDKLRGSGDDR